MSLLAGVVRRELAQAQEPLSERLIGCVTRLQVLQGHHGLDGLEDLVGVLDPVASLREIEHALVRQEPRSEEDGEREN